ncbi:MAG: MBL fold metallo-hydrolase [Acidobacteriota bacterium]
MTNARILSVLGVAAVCGVTLLGQGPQAGEVQPVAPSPAIDLSGYWTPVQHEDQRERGAGSEIGDYGGFALNEAGRLWALSYDPSRVTLKHHQCDAYVTPYQMRATGNFRVWEERDPYNQRLVAIHVWGQTTEGHRVIWMDGRAHPPSWAPHSFRGFSTGEFVGHALRVTTTHMKQGWLRRNGTPQSDQATMIDYFTRHGDHLSNVTVVTDPVFLSEPEVRSNDYSRQPVDHQAWLYACDDGEQILDRPADVVPNYLFGKQPFVKEFSDRYKIPMMASLAGADSIYPEFGQRLAKATPAEATALLSPAPGRPNETSKVANPDPQDGEIHTYKLRRNLYLLLGDSANIVVSAGDQGAFVIDTGAGRLTDKVVAAIQRLTPKPIQFIANTSFHREHVGGNVKLADAGADLGLPGSFFAGGGAVLGSLTTGLNRPVGSTATMIAHANVQVRMQSANAPADAVPADTYLEDRRRKFYNGEGVELFHYPNAVTDGDSVVHFRGADVIVTGDIFTTTQYPFIDVANGGTIQGEIKALNEILDKTVFEHEEDGGTIIVPGHGYVSNEHEVLEYRDMAVIVRDRVQAMLNAGATLEQVQAARLTADYDTRYGANSGDWTTAKFVEAVYKTLKPQAPKPPAAPRPGTARTPAKK